MSAIRYKIITPERIVVSGEAQEITLPVEGGEVTLLPEHMPYIGALKAGEIRLRHGEAGAEESVATSGGFAEFHGDELTLLADTAERAVEIDLSRAEDAYRRAEEAMQERVTMDDEEYARTAALIEKEFARVRVAKRHRSQSRAPESIQ
jgi:F-type H+-transporting ATPase subunit epsilon